MQKGQFQFCFPCHLANVPVIYCRYEGAIGSGVIRVVIGSWYFYSLIITASYAGEIRYWQNTKDICEKKWCGKGIDLALERVEITIILSHPTEKFN